MLSFCLAKNVVKHGATLKVQRTEKRNSLDSPSFHPNVPLLAIRAPLGNIFKHASHGPYSMNGVRDSRVASHILPFNRLTNQRPVFCSASLPDRIILPGWIHFPRCQMVAVASSLLAQGGASGLARLASSSLPFAACLPDSLTKYGVTESTTPNGSPPSLHTGSGIRAIIQPAARVLPRSLSLPWFVWLTLALPLCPLVLGWIASHQPIPVSHPSCLASLPHPPHPPLSSSSPLLR